MNEVLSHIVIHEKYTPANSPAANVSMSLHIFLNGNDAHFVLYLFNITRCNPFISQGGVIKVENVVNDNHIVHTGSTHFLSMVTQLSQVSVFESVNWLLPSFMHVCGHLSIRYKAK